MPAAPKAKHPARRKHAVHAARQMRREPTPAEQIVWEMVRDRKIDGKKFRRQHPIDRYIADFYCAEAALVIEIDGAIHAEPNHDALRQQIIEAHGLRVLRFPNADVFDDPAAVLAHIRAALATNPPSP